MPALQPAAAHAPVHAAHFARLAAAYTAELTPATQADLDEAWGLLEPPVEEEESLPAGTAPPRPARPANPVRRVASRHRRRRAPYGALFSVGDGHVRQGDGEVGRTALECPMDRVRLRFTLEASARFPRPWARTPSDWITFGFAADLNEATLQALDHMLTLLETEYAVARPEALALASLLVDLRVTQVANGVHGVHALLPLDALQR